ncbi:hypothetical protein Cgig2_012549 [Carnegiea gigantea]|uniref:Uncharacterized protein n=1 Tax=Carnegiea gigantea TaxID=171969 RepID=A0A9Q1JLB4_9CARY|nr:hypothetical protein Cgig2_012549 [Carnegiea gigantea]
MIITKTELESRGCAVTPISREKECPEIDPLLAQLKRGRPPNERRRDIIEKRKVYTRSNTLRCSKYKSHEEGNVLEIRPGKDKPRKPKVGDKRRVARPSKVDGNTLKKAKTTQGTSSPPTIATPSLSQPRNQELLHLTQQELNLLQEHKLLQLDKEDLKLLHLGKPDSKLSRLEVPIF